MGKQSPIFDKGGTVNVAFEVTYADGRNESETLEIWVAEGAMPSDQVTTGENSSYTQTAPRSQ